MHVKGRTEARSEEPDSALRNADASTTSRARQSMFKSLPVVRETPCWIGPNFPHVNEGMLLAVQHCARPLISRGRRPNRRGTPATICCQRSLLITYRGVDPAAADRCI